MPRAKRERKRALSPTANTSDSSPKKTKQQAPDCERSLDERSKQAEDSRDREGFPEDFGSAVSSVESFTESPKGAKLTTPEAAAGAVVITTKDTNEIAIAASPTDTVSAPLLATATRAGDSANNAGCTLSRLGDLPPEVGVQITSKLDTASCNNLIRALDVKRGDTVAHTVDVFQYADFALIEIGVDGLEESIFKALGPTPHEVKYLHLNVDDSPRAQEDLYRTFKKFTKVKLKALTFTEGSQLCDINGNALVNTVDEEHRELLTITVPSILGGFGHAASSQDLWRLRPSLRISLLTLSRQEHGIENRTINIQPGASLGMVQGIIKRQEEIEALAIEYLPATVAVRPSAEEILDSISHRNFQHLTMVCMVGLDLNACWHARVTKETGCEVIPFPSITFLEVSLCTGEGGLWRWIDWQYVLREGSLTKFIYTISKHSMDDPAPSNVYRTKLNQLGTMLCSFSGLEGFGLVLPENLNEEESLENISGLTVVDEMFQKHSSTIRCLSIIFEGGQKLGGSVSEALAARYPHLWNMENLHDCNAYMAWVESGFIPGWNREWADPQTMGPGYLPGMFA